jgi:3-isopropylmalate dehydrogenase
MSLEIGILLGDDIGLEVVPECIKVMKAAAAREHLALEWRPLPIGKQGHLEHGNTLPRVTEDALRELDGWIMGPIGHAAYPRGDPTWVMPPVRKKFDLFAAVRPALSHAAIPSIHKNVDIVFCASSPRACSIRKPSSLDCRSFGPMTTSPSPCGSSRARDRAAWRARRSRSHARASTRR